MSTKPKVAILGLGIMGTGMASRLTSQGFPVTVFNRSPRPGMTIAKTPREAASGANIIISMLADDDAARAIWLGKNGALSSLSPSSAAAEEGRGEGSSQGPILIESSTVSPEWIEELSQAANKIGCELLDAPVTGSKLAAANGELTFLVGGSDAALATARPVLAAMSKEINHIGPSGSGALMKLINNFVCGIQAVALAEAIAIIERSGLDREKAVAVLTNGAPGSPLVKLLSGRMLKNDFTPNFLMKLMAKDLRYAQNLGNIEVVSAALRTFEKAIKSGYGDKDFSSVVESLRKSGKEKP